MQTLSQQQLNRAVLARQLLLERAPTPLPRALERIAGIQAQYAPSMYVGLWSRLENLHRDALTQALERRSVIQATLMRSTIHLVSKADFWPLALATREARRAHWLRSMPDPPSAREMTAAARKLRGALDGAMSRKEVEALLGKDVARAIGLWIDLVRVPPSGTWERRRADLYAAAEDWLGPPPEIEDAKAHLVRRYLAGFGPASRQDVVSFTGLLPADAGAVLDRLRLRRFRSEHGQELFDVPRAPLPDPDTPAPPRFLPTWDAILLVHARRAGVLPEEHRPKVFSVRNPHSSPTFLVDGRVAGTWKHEKGAIRLEPFGRLDATARRELRSEADRLAEFHA
ncbi:MAG TPA: winged helix DNA-binding domain-containing protein [Solirubrobacteraceae bacterium]|nr:winged helix DNA-binding domain-containing protein [Solirubrobacteraceae bacterium]